MRATLTIAPLPGGDVGDKLVTLDCKHGTTTIYHLCSPDGERVTDAALVAIAFDKHRQEQPACHCIDHLIRRYGLANRPKETAR